MSTPNGLHPCRETANFHEFRPVTYVTPPPPKPVYPELRRRAPRLKFQISRAPGCAALAGPNGR